MRLWKKTKKPEEIKFLDSIQKLEIKDDDIIVLKCPHLLSAGNIARIKTDFGKLLVGCKNVRIAILEDGLDIGVLTKKENGVKNAPQS